MQQHVGCLLLVTSQCGPAPSQEWRMESNATSSPYSASMAEGGMRQCRVTDILMMMVRAMPNNSRPNNSPNNSRNNSPGLVVALCEPTIQGSLFRPPPGLRLQPPTALTVSLRRCLLASPRRRHGPFCPSWISLSCHQV